MTQEHYDIMLMLYAQANARNPKKVMKSQSDRRRYASDPVYREAKQAQAAAKRQNVRESKQK